MFTAKLLQADPRRCYYLTDDFGWGDLPSYGHPTQERGAIDTMAKEDLHTRAALGSPPIVKKKSSTRNFKFQVMETYLPNLRTFLAPNSSA